MLNWWLGKPMEGKRVPDASQDAEAPDTPAIAFAGRALKSAIFGTPAPPEDETFYEGESESEIIGEEDIKGRMAGSPTKPQGILLTPGTGARGGKTVTFGSEVMDNFGSRITSKTSSKSGMPDDCPGKFPSPFPETAVSSSRTKRKTSLTKQLEKARTSTAGSTPFTKTHTQSNTYTKPYWDSGPSQTKPASPSKFQSSNQGHSKESVVHEEFDGDMTLDLNEPHSQSGKYWKTHFEQYHEDAKMEMAKLLKYKHLAKSYAKLKDGQSVDLEEKLKEEQRKVVVMEDQISSLTDHIASAAMYGTDQSPELTMELARQTAVAVQFKSEVEEFRVALESQKGASCGISANEGKRLTPARIEDTLNETSLELKKAREQLQEMATLRGEKKHARQMLIESEKTVEKLQDENTKLTQDLLHADLRLENHLEKCEKKRKSFEEKLHRRDEEVQGLKNKYEEVKELAKRNRVDAEQLLRGRHDQVVLLRKEIASLRGAESIAQDLQRTLQKKSAEHDKIVAGLQTQIQELKANQKDTPEGRGEAKRVKLDRPNKSLDLFARPLPSLEAKESRIPQYSPPLARPLRAAASYKTLRTDTPSKSPRPRSSHSALSEIVNRASADSVPPPRYGPVQRTPLPPQITPLASRLSHLSLDTPLPEMHLPSPEPSLAHLPTKTVHERIYRPSPCPSMFNIASSPPRAAVVRHQASGDLIRHHKSHNDLAARRLANLPSSRVSSLDGSKVRAPLPPDRAAAAKARLEEKNKEKKERKQGGGERNKENIR